MAKKTVLYEEHLKLNATMVDYADWLMPTHYTSIVEEHNAVRNNAGLFDVSHMGEIEVQGKDALDYVQYIVTNNPAKMENNQVIYTFMCNENGGVVDDLLVYKYHEEHFLLVVNASNIEKDFDWLNKHKADYQITIDNISDKVSLIALQGPKAQEIMQKLTDLDLNNIPSFRFDDKVVIAKNTFLVSRTGYTGEDGFEIYGAANSILVLWKTLLDIGENDGLLPAGLGCRDTLRFEANLPLYGNELSDSITPIEAGYGFFVDITTDFIGKDILAKQKEEGVSQKVVGFELSKKGIARHGYDVLLDDNKIGVVTTGYNSITLHKSIGLALINKTDLKIGDMIEIAIRNKTIEAQIISRKFLK